MEANESSFEFLEDIREFTSFLDFMDEPIYHNMESVSGFQEDGSTGSAIPTLQLTEPLQDDDYFTKLINSVLLPGNAERFFPNLPTAQSESAENNRSPPCLVLSDDETAPSNEVIEDSLIDVVSTCPASQQSVSSPGGSDSRSGASTPRTSTSIIDYLPPCQVCHGKSSGLHYGE